MAQKRNACNRRLYCIRYCMNIPLELIIITRSKDLIPELNDLSRVLQQQFAGVIIHFVSLENAQVTISNFTIKENRQFIVYTKGMTNPQEVDAIFQAIDRIRGGIIMFPTSISNNRNYLFARTNDEVVTHLNWLSGQNRTFQSPAGRSNIPVNLTSNLTSVTQRPISPAYMGQPKLGVNFFKSNNQTFNHDANKIIIDYQNEKRVKFNVISNLNQINLMQGGQHIVFVSDTDANIFISQLRLLGQRSSNFFPILYNTSSRSIPTGEYFVVAVNSLQRAKTEINTYINNQSAIGSNRSISEQIAMSASTIPPMRSMSPMGINTMTSQTLLNNNFSSGTIQLSAPHTRLIVFDPGSLYFKQFYQTLPVDYKYIERLEPNAQFKQPTILLAPIEVYEHVMRSISSDVIYPVKCVFYSPTMANLPANYTKMNSVIYSNPREIEAYLRSNNVLFMTTNITTIRNETVFDNNQQVSAFAGMNGTATGIWGEGPRTHQHEWTVRRKPGMLRHQTHSTSEQHLHMAKTLGTGIIPQTSINMNTDKRMIGSLQNFQINSIPNQSQMILNKTSFNSPKTLVNQSDVKEVITTTTINQPPPINLTSRVVEEVYEETVIETRNRQHSNLNSQESNNHTITIDQIPIMPTIEITPPPMSRLSTTQPSNLQVNIQPVMIPPQRNFVAPPIIQQINQVVAPVIKEVVIETAKYTPAPTPIIEVPSITNGYYSTSTTVHTPQIRQSMTSYSPHRSPSPVNVSRRVVESEWMDPIKYQKTFQNGKVTYVMRQQYKNRLIDDAVARNGATTYHQTDYLIDHSPRVHRKSRVTYDTYVKPTFNEVEYVVENPKIRRSRVIYQDAPSTTLITGGTQILEASMTSPTLDPLKYEGRIENGVQVYYKRSSVSPLRRSNHLFVDQVTTPIQYRTSTTHSPVVYSQPLRKSIVIEQRIPRSSSRVLLQHNPSHEVIELRRSGTGLRGSRVYRTSRVDDTRIGRQPVHLIFKKLNSTLVSTSQLFKDPQYQIHKYYGSNELAAIARNIPSTEPILLISDEVPDSVDYFLNHSNFNTVIIPKNRSYSRAHEVKYPKYKWISQEDPERVYGEIVTYIDEQVYNTRPNYYVNRVSNDLNHFVSPGHYGNSYERSYTQQVDTRPGIVNSSKKVLLFPVDRSQVRDFTESRLPNTFDFIPYTDMNSLTKQLDYWPGTNIVAVLSEPLAQQIGTIMRISRNADYVIYDPNNRYGNQKQDYNSIKRVRNVQDLVTELEYLVGGVRGRSYR